MSDLVGPWAAQEEAAAALARYEANRCPCGGSPMTLYPNGTHRADFDHTALLAVELARRETA